MKAQHFTFNDGTGLEIYVYKWLPDAVEDIKGVFQIAHGMAEHAARYEKFAKVLTDNGYAVFANDHRGHGKTAGNLENIGRSYDGDLKVLIDEIIQYDDKTIESQIIKENISLIKNGFIKNGWDLVVFDMFILTEIMKKEFPDKPIFLFGHSMGSLLSRTYMIKLSEKFKDLISGVILSGTSGDPGLIGDVGMIIAKIIAFLNGREKPSNLLNTMSFGKFNNAFKPNRTEFDWLSRDENEVDRYVADPYCGWVASAGFFIDMLEGLKFTVRLRTVCRTCVVQIPVLPVTLSLAVTVLFSREGMARIFLRKDI